MFADESSNGSTSSTCSSKASMFMIDNLLHHKDSVRDTRVTAVPRQKTITHTMARPVPIVTAPESRPFPACHSEPIQPQCQPSQNLFSHLQMCTSISPLVPSPSGSVSPSRETPPLSETLFRSLDLINSFHNNPDFAPHEPMGIALPGSTQAPVYSPEVHYQGHNHLSPARLPPKKRHKLNANQATLAPEHQFSADRPISPANSTTSSLDDDVSPAEKKKKARTNFSNYQLSELEAVFCQQRYLPANERKDMAQRLQLSERKVKTWFQNRRMKDKRFPRDDQSPRDDPQTPLQTVMTSQSMTSLHQMQTTTPHTPSAQRTMTSLPFGTPPVPIAFLGAAPSTPTMQYGQTNLGSQIISGVPEYGHYGAMRPSFDNGPHHLSMADQGDDAGSLSYQSPYKMTML